MTLPGFNFFLAVLEDFDTFSLSVIDATFGIANYESTIDKSACLTAAKLVWSAFYSNRTWFEASSRTSGRRPET